MSPHAWTEDQLVERPAVGLFAELGRQTVHRPDMLGALDSMTHRRKAALQTWIVRGIAEAVVPALKHAARGHVGGERVSPVADIHDHVIAGSSKAIASLSG